MRVVVAPDSFKGTLSATAAAEAFARGWHEVRPQDDVRLFPMADGGEGTLTAFLAAVPGARRRPVVASGPTGRTRPTSWVELPAADAAGTTAVVELGEVCGIELMNDLAPESAHTYGLGEVIADALRAGAGRVVVGLGSSASTDGGVGMLRALGARALDETGAEVPLGGAGLAAVASLDLSGLPPLPPGGVVGLTDVTNPLCGPVGSAAVFGPQKGADVEQIRVLDAGLARLSALVPWVDARTPGAGAAGGVGFGLLVWGAALTSGAAAVAESIGLPAALARADVVVTGEGAYDGQSAAGKVPVHVAALAGAARRVLVAGRIAADADATAFDIGLSLTELAGSVESALADPARWIAEAARRSARRIDL